MGRFQLTANENLVYCIEDGRYIPRGNPAWSEYEAFLAGGGKPLPLIAAKTVAVLLAEVAAYRYHIETAGIIVDGRRINTEAEAQSKLNSAFVSLLNGLIPITDWKADDGSWVQVDLDGLRPIAAAVAQHVAACYTAEMRHQDAIKLLKTQVEIDSYDVTTGWPA